MLTKTEIASLIEKYLEGTISSNEQQLLQEWRDSHDGRNQLFKELTDDDGFAQSLKNYHPDVWKESRTKIRTAIWASIEKTGNQRIVHRVHFLKTAWFKYAAAIILVCGLSTYLWFNNISDTNHIATTNKPVPGNNILPGGERARLTLADGSTIILDSVANGQLAVQQGSSIIKKDGRIIYDAGQQTTTQLTYNTMSTPRGGQYQLTLPDGTQVWLNAASSITYPTAFIEKQRMVKISGEVYFEVSKNKEKPFIVNTGKDLITVLGTSFNVNNYPDEPVSKISLLEGSVRIKDKILKPGEAFQNGKITITNVEQDIAWKNGIFNFHGKNVEEVMRQLSRWYNIDITYEGKPPSNIFYGKMGKNLSLTKVLEFLEKSGIHVKVDGNKVKVLN